VDERYYKRVGHDRTTTYSVVLQWRDVSILVNRPIALAVIACVSLTGGVVRAQRADPRTAPPRLTALDPRWTLSFATAPAAPVGFDREMAYVPAKSGDLVAILLDDGTEKWRARLSTAFTPATGDGLVFAAGDRVVAAFEQRSGQPVWRVEVGGPIVAPPHWETGLVFVSLESGELLALNAGDGRIAWKQPLGAVVAVPPAASQDRLYIALSDGRVVALDIDRGDTIWTHPVNEPVTGMLALQEQLLVGTKANLLHSLSTNRGRQRWAQKVGSDVIGPAAADEDLIYFVAYDNVLRALSRGSGNLRWTRNLPRRPSGGPVLIEDLVLVPFAAEMMGAYRADTGAEAFSIGAAGELLGGLFLRENVQATVPRVIAQTREGSVQGFAPRVEAPPAPLAALPGSPVGQ
jgi:outer membrane protein assembly factor BamB